MGYKKGVINFRSPKSIERRNFKLEGKFSSRGVSILLALKKKLRGRKWKDRREQSVPELIIERGEQVMIMVNFCINKVTRIRLKVNRKSCGVRQREEKTYN